MADDPEDDDDMSPAAVAVLMRAAADPDGPAVGLRAAGLGYMLEPIALADLAPTDDDLARWLGDDPGPAAA